MTTKNLLVELFVEELPPKALKKLGEAFASVLADSLRAQGLATDASTVTPFASPRRLAAHVTSVVARAVDRQERVRVMPLKVAFDPNGRLTAPAVKRLGGLGLPAGAQSKLERDFEEKRLDSEFLFVETLIPGAELTQGLQKALAKALADLPIPKVMQYQLADGWTSVNFVRPAHGLVALHGDDVVPVQTLGLTAGRSTHGHRFEAQVDPIELKNADEYAERLAADGAAIAGFAARRDEIARQLQAAAAKQGLTPIHDDALLDEVTALVERPNVLICKFDEDFLGVPPECLILTMKANQKYFPLLDAAGKLTNQFLVVSNIRPADASRVIEGNERVVRPRLADAKFFFDQDRKRTLESRVAGLDKVVYHGKLGTQGERVLRVRAIAKAIGQELGGDALAAQADRAAMLAKADLLTDMVGEFPELQGIMGGYYAVHDGERADVAQAVEDHYKPRFAGDALPRNMTGVVVALADKLETLTGLFGIGQLPTGDKDPFALRRHALGLIRMLVESKSPLDVHALVDLAVGVHNDHGIQRQVSQRAYETGLARRSAGSPGEFVQVATAVGHRQVAARTAALVVEFIYERLASLLREQGYTAQEIDAVLGLRPARLGDVAARLAAVRAFVALPEAAPLAAANKRVGNILKKVEGAVMYGTPVAALLVERAEVELDAAVSSIRSLADAAFARGDYISSLQALAALKGPVDAFFETVMVNAEDTALRANRLGLLNALYLLMNRVADLSKLAT